MQGNNSQNLIETTRTTGAIPIAILENADGKSGDIIDALEGRRSFYDLLAALYFKPLTSEQIDNFEKFDLSAYAEINESFAEGANDIVRYLNKRNSGTRQELAVDFTGCFGGVSTWKGRYAVPYESVFTSDEGLLYQGSFHEVHSLFKSGGIARAEGYDYPDDHLSFMFEYLGILTTRAIRSLGESDAESALRHLAVSREFLDNHILSWFDRFADIASNLLATRFYRGVLKITKGFLVFDSDLLDEITANLTFEAARSPRESRM